MRSEIKQKLFELTQRIEDEKRNLSTFVDNFVFSHKLGEVGIPEQELLSDYNHRMLTWLHEWAITFQKELSEFAGEDSLLTVCIHKREQLFALIMQRVHFGLPHVISDLTRTYYFPAHKMLLACAEFAVDEQTFVCQFMMPWVGEVIGGAVSGDVKASTENAEGKFIPAEFISNESGSGLIDVLGYVDYIRDNSVIADAFFRNPARQQLMRDRCSIKYKEYIIMLRYLHERRTQDPSNIGFHLFQLATSLYERSENRRGNYHFANSGYRDVIVQFHSIWASLPSEDQEKIKYFRSDPNGISLGEDLLVLFSSENLLNDVEEKQVTIIMKKYNRDTSQCVAVTAGRFFSALDKHREWYAIKVNAVETRNIYETPDFEAVRTVLEKELHDPDSYLTQSQHFVIQALNGRWTSCYQRFFEWLPMIATLHRNQLLSVNQHPKESCQSTDDVFTYLFQIQNRDDRRACWRFFEKYWVNFIDEYNAIIFLHYCLDVSYLSAFSKGIQCYFSEKSSLLRYEKLSGWCEKYASSLHAVRLSFIFSLVKDASFFIADTDCFFRCVFACETPAELRKLLILMSEHALILQDIDNKKRGSALLAISDKAKRLADDLQAHSFHYNDFMQQLLQVQLPILLSDRVLEQIGGGVSSSHCALFSCISKYRYNNFMNALQECKNPLDRFEKIYSEKKRKIKDNALKRISNHFHPAFFSDRSPGRELMNRRPSEEWLNFSYASV
ncbi:MAG: hypothetical protein A2624_01865 [Gammaproteobacteria bacterium RIFCSPHIGHO2_01_FULL_42_8]|nr:MAG: hypothetical protein A2624_01865 [Gammaproteobacteria bacterium RIFCSPHIGHO2_01_FULL_42_8]